MQNDNPLSDLNGRANGSTTKNDLGTDLLEGAEAISQYIFGDPKHRRKVYHLASRNRIPTFNMGATLYARRSKILRWIEEQESRSHSQAK